MGRVALVHIDPAAFSACYGGTFQFGPLDTGQLLSDAIADLVDDDRRAQYGANLHQWLLQHHGHTAVARRYLATLTAEGISIDQPDVDMQTDNLTRSRPVDSGTEQAKGADRR